MGVARPVGTPTTAADASAASVVAPFLATAHRRWLADETGNRWRRRTASLVFGGVSGFTTLSERLAAQGTGGAEELTDVLNGAVGRVLDAAAAHGGDLLKYGDDAILIAFEGPGHERRATQAAVALPPALRGLPGETAGVQLEMSIGVATGELDLFLVGDDHCELVVCGPLVSTAVCLEHDTAPGEVFADGTTAAAVNDARWSGPERGGHVLLIPPPASTVGLGLGPNGSHDVRPSALLRAIPTGLRTRLGAPAEGEHRQVAVAFVEVMGVDDLLDREGHAAVADALDAVVRTAQAACATYHTTFLSTGAGNGAVTIVLTAGAPDAGTDDVGRLLLAARKVTATNCALAVRAGVHHGRAFAVEVGSERRRVYTVLGDAVHLAARLMSRSEPGVVLATDSSLAEAQTRFVARALAPFAVHDRTELIVASAVDAPLGEGAYRSAATSPLAGRDAERNVLLAALDDARAGAGRIVVVLGDAGIGKSRLVAEVIAAVPDLPRLHVTGRAHAVDCPYLAMQAPLRRLLSLDAEVTADTVVEALLGVVGPGGDAWLPLLAPAFGVTLPDTPVTARVEARSRRPRAHALVTDVLRQLLPDRALVVVDDAHWLDDASTELIGHLLGAFAEAPWLVLVSRRDQPGGLQLPPSAGATQVVLHPLDSGAAAALLRSAGEDELSPTALDALIARGGGNPLFLEQLWGSAASGTAVDDLPDTVEAVIAARIDTLDPTRRQQLRAASVLGQRFPATLLTGLLADADVDAAESLAGFLEPDEPGWVRFQHALVQAGAYDGLSGRSRRNLHGLVGELIEADPLMFSGRAELLSRHYTEAQRWEPAWRWSLQAAERSAASGAPVEAARFLRRAVGAAGHLDIEASELSWVYERLADAEELNGRLDDAADVLTRSRRLADDPVRVAHLLQRHGHISDRAGSYVAAQRWFARGLRELAGAPPSATCEQVRIDLVIAQASTKVRQGRLREAETLLEVAAAAADAAGHQRALAMACNLLSTILYDLGRTEEASEYLDRAAPLYEQLGDLTGQAAAHDIRGVEAYHRGDWDMAAARWRRAAHLYEQAGDVASQGMVLSNLGKVR